MSKLLTIDGRKISSQHRPYVIAELSANHNGNIENAFKIIDAAKQAGADAVKLQTYRPDTITIRSDRPEFKIKGGLWDGKTLYDLYDWAHTPWEWHELLFAKAREIGITLFSSPFDFTAVDLLEDLGAPAYKISSFEAIDLPLIKYVALTGKPMIISTGMANEAEIHEAVETALENGCRELALLHCVSGYPAPAEDYNLKTIPDMAKRFGLITGLSDHTLDNTTALTAIALGACIVEKHVTLNRSGGGPDDSFSLEPKELEQLCSGAQTAWSALGKASYERKESEKGNAMFRRSLYVTVGLKAGEMLTPDNTKSIRPGMGLAPKHYEQVLGKKVRIDILPGTPLCWEIIEK